MYDNIAGKIKGLAKATFICVAIASVITGIALWIDEFDWWLCVLIIFCGPVVAWISSWFLYGLGEIIDKLCDIEQNTRGGQSKTKFREDVAKKMQSEAEARAKREAEEKAKREAAKIERRMSIEREISDIEYVDITCPHCKEKLSFTKGISEANCPFCECNIHIN